MEEKRNYQHELLELCAQWWARYEDTVAEKPHARIDWPSFLHEFVKQIALDSFKNGVQAGIRRASTRPTQGNAPSPSRRQAKGSALGNGKLQRALVVEDV